MKKVALACAFLLFAFVLFLGEELMSIYSSKEPVLLSSMQGKFRPVSFRVSLLFGANPDEQSDLGQTALMEASSLCSLKYVELLILNGANPTLENKYGETALMQIGYDGTDRAMLIAKTLIQAGADVSVKSRDGRSALDNARNIGDRRLVDYLLSVQRKLD